MSKRLVRYTNREYDIPNADEAVVMRSLHVNEIVDVLNEEKDTRIENTDAGDSQAIIIGSTATDRAIFIKYSANANAETLFEAGDIRVLVKDGTPTVSRTSYGDDLGMTFSVAAGSGTNIELTLTASALNGTVEFIYKKEIIKKQKVT